MEGGGSEVARLCVGDVVGAVGPDDGALFKWAGTFFGWACSGGLKMGGIAVPLLSQDVEFGVLGKGGKGRGPTALAC